MTKFSFCLFVISVTFIATGVLAQGGYSTTSTITAFIGGCFMGILYHLGKRIS